MNEDDAMTGQKVLEVLLRRMRQGQRQILVHWQCQWIPIGDCDPGALEDFLGEEVSDFCPRPVSQTIVPVKKRKRVRRRNW